MKQKIELIVVIVLSILLILVVKTIVKSESNKKINGNIPVREMSAEEKEKYDVLEVTEATFEEEVLKSDKKVCIDFYADWCGPCKALSPIVKEVAKENSNVKVVSINTDENANLSKKYKIEAIPTLIIIENGKEVKRSVGLIDKNEIEKFIEN